MPGKPYIKTGNSTWTKVKRIYIKSGGQTWAPIRKAYIKVRESGSVSGRWAKFYDTTSNRPFIEGNDRPKIRLNTFRPNSTYNPTGTENDPVNPVVEAPPVQQMGPPTTTPTSGWPSGTIGNHLWGYDGDWRSGNGSAITYTYQWLYNLSGDRNDNTFDPAFSPAYSSTTNASNTSSTGRADMLTNTSAYLGRGDGDYFDKNFLTFRVVATNSAGSVAEESDTQLYIVRQKPTGTINLINTSVDVPETLSASFTYSNEWYRKTDVSDSRIEWFAIDAIGDPLTTSNRVAIETLSGVTVTGTTTKSGTVFHNATVPNKIYAVRLTLNNSNTQAAVIPISGFTPGLPFTTEDYSTPGSPLTVTTLNILDYFSNAGTDNRGYIPVGGLFRIQSSVTGTDGSTTYRIRYRMYNWQNNSYYGMDGTNYGSSASSAWTTRTGSNSSFGPGGTLISNISVSGTTATLLHNEVISSSLFGSTTFGTGQDRWQIEIEVSALKNSIRKYYADVVGGIPYYVSRPATLLLTASPENTQVNQNVTLNGTITALGGGLSYPRQYKVSFGDGNDSGWLPVGEYSFGTSNPTFQITKQYSTVGEYFPVLTTIPDYSSTNTYVVVSAALTAPTISSVTYDGSSVSINFSGGSGPYYELYWSSDPTAANGLLTNYYDAASTSSPLTESISIPAGATRYFWLRSSSVNRGNTTASGNAANGTFGPWASSGFAFTAPNLTAPTSTSIVSVSRLNNTQTRVIVSSSGGNGPYYQLYWVASSTAPTTASYDAASTTSTVTEDYEFSNGITYYFYIRSSNQNLGNTTVNGTATAGTYSAYGPATGAAFYTFAQPSGTVSVSPSSGTGGTTQFTASPSVSASPSAQISYQWQYFEGGAIGWAAISGATSSTYTPPSNYASIYGSSLRCQITANNGVGTTLTTASSTVTVTAPATKLSTPTNVSASDARTDGILVSWTNVSNAATYGVWWGGAPGYDNSPDFGGPNSNGGVSITSSPFLDTGAPVGSRNYYVQAFPSTGSTSFLKSDWSAGDSGTRLAAPVKLSTPTGVSASDNRTDGINITWNAVSGASYYGVWWGGAPGYDNTPDFQNIFGTSYLDSGAPVGSRNYYVQAFASGNPTGTKSDWGGPDSGTRLSVPVVTAPSTPTGVNTSGSGLVTWTASSGATSYTVEYYTATNSSGANQTGPYYGSPGNSTSFQISYPVVNSVLQNWARARVLASNSGGSSAYSGFSPASGFA